MKCDRPGCHHDAIAFLTVAKKTYGYCQEHRRCKNCGLEINGSCRCNPPVERPEFLKYMAGKSAKVEVRADATGVLKAQVVHPSAKRGKVITQ